MPRQKKVVTTVVTEPEDDSQPSNVAAEFGEVLGDDVPADLENFIEEIGEGATKVVLFRRAKDGKSPYVGAYAAHEFDLEMVKQEYGGGSYFCRVYGSGGVKKTYRFTIDESIKPVPPEFRSNAANPRDAMIEQLLVKLAGGGGGKDPMEIAAEFAKASSQQMASTIAMILPLFEKMAGGGKSGGVSEMLEVMEFGINHFGGGHGEGDGFMGVVKEVGLPLVDILKTQLNQPKGGAVANPPAQIPSNVPSWVGVVRTHLTSLMPYIQAGADPGMIAAAMETKIPKFVRWLDGAVQDVNFRPQLFAHIPELGPYAQWVDDFLAEFGPEEDDDTVPDTPPASTGNVVTDQPPEGDEPVM